MVNWKKQTTLLEEKNLFSLLRVYEQVVFKAGFIIDRYGAALGFLLSLLLP